MDSPQRPRLSARLRVAAGLFALLPTLACLGQSRPNILFIAIDDLRPELGCYGAAQVKTPQLDRFASSAVRFDRAYCQVPVCGASRASLMTGVLPTPRRFTIYSSRADEDAPGAPTLPEILRKAGYVTLSNGKVFHHADDTQDASWSEAPWQPDTDNFTSFDPETRRQLSATGRGRIYESPDVPDDAYSDGKVAAKTIRDLQRLKEAGQPFFVACGLNRPHMPFYAPKRYWDLYDRSSIRIAENRGRPESAPSALQGSTEYHQYHFGPYVDNTDDFHRMMRHGYLASVSYADKLVGDVLAAVDRLGLAENTIVVVWGDHGWNLGEHNFWGKHTTMHTAMRVPLLVRAPGKTSGVARALVASVDIFPTLCALAQVASPPSVQGRSFVPLLADPEKQPFRDVIYSRFRNGDAVVTQQFTYTSYGKNGEMLYDLAKDPAENLNVAAVEGYRVTRDRMEELLQKCMLEAAGAQVAAPHAKSASDKPGAAQ